jgi:hypothetical protein
MLKYKNQGITELIKNRGIPKHDEHRESRKRIKGSSSLSVHSAPMVALALSADALTRRPCYHGGPRSPLLAVVP